MVLSPFHVVLSLSSRKLTSRNFSLNPVQFRLTVTHIHQNCCFPVLLLRGRGFGQDSGRLAALQLSCKSAMRSRCRSCSLLNSAINFTQYVELPKTLNRNKQLKTFHVTVNGQERGPQTSPRGEKSKEHIKWFPRPSNRETHTEIAYFLCDCLRNCHVV